MNLVLGIVIGGGCAVFLLIAIGAMNGCPECRRYTRGMFGE